MSVMPSMTRRLRRSARDLASRVQCALLMLSLWHAPIPWVHFHDLQGPQVDRLELLSQHVAEFHARDLDQGTQRLTWHAHLVLPWCLSHHLPCPEGDQRQPGSDDFLGQMKMSKAGACPGETIGQPTTRAFLAQTFVIDLAPVLPNMEGASTAIFALARATHFFETYGAASVRDLVGVRLC